MSGRPVLARRPALVLAAMFLTLTTAYSVLWMHGVRWRPTSRIGFTPDFSAGQARIESVIEGGPANRAGLRPGDVIGAIDGQPITGPVAIVDTVGRKTPGTVVRLSIARGTESFDVPVTLEPVPPELRPTLTDAALNETLRLYPLGFLAVAIFVLIQRPQDRHAWLLAILFASFIAGAPITEEAVAPGLRRLVTTWRTVFSTAGPVVFYLFFATFPARSPLDRRAPWLKWVLAGAGLVSLVLVLSKQVAAAGPVAPSELHRLVVPGGGWFLPLYATAAYLLGAVSLVWNNVRAPTAEARRRTRMIVFGTIVGFGPIFTLQLIAQGQSIYTVFPVWMWSAAVLMLFLLPISFAYAVVRYRVLEVPVLLRRSARYLFVQRGFVVLIMIVSIAGTLGIASALTHWFPTDPQTTAVSALLAGAALAWGGAHTKRRVTERIDRAFFRTAYDARRLLEELADRAFRATDREQLASLIENSLESALHPATLIVYLRSDRDGSFQASRGNVPSAAFERLDPRIPELDHLAQIDEPMVLPPPADDQSPRSALAPLGAECLVPLTGRTGEMVGVVVLGPRRSEEPYSREDLRLLAAVARQAGLALENIMLAERMAERLEAERRSAREMDIARDVQRKLFPQKFPSVPSIEYAGACFQARAVGGDYYDFLDFGPGSVGFVLADISGKGIHAALLMASLQANLRSQHALARTDVGALLESVERLFFESTASHHFATMFFGRYEDRSRRMVYANCGQNPPLLVRATGEIEWLQPTTTVLGLFDVWSCRISEVNLDPGDTLIIYTDGVIEARSDDGEEFGEDRLIEVVCRHRHLRPDALLGAVTGAVHSFSGTEQEDDITLVGIRAK